MGYSTELFKLLTCSPQRQSYRQLKIHSYEGDINLFFTASYKLALKQ